MTSARPILVRPLLLGFIILHASAYVLRKRSWDSDLNDALRILQNGNDEQELIFEEREDEPEEIWSSEEEREDSRPNGYFYRDYDRAGDQDSADLDAAEDRLLLENFLDQEGAEDFGQEPIEDENNDFDDIGEVPDDISEDIRPEDIQDIDKDDEYIPLISDLQVSQLVW